MLNNDNALLLVIDMQEKLVNMLKSDECAKNTAKLVQACTKLDIETIITEQYPKGLGNTVEIIKNEVKENAKTLEKTAFSAWKENEIQKTIINSNKKQIIILGIEAHICVYQTAIDLVEAGYEVYFIKDCSASRNKKEFKSGIELMKQFGVKISCLEIILFELLKSSKNPYFKEIQDLIK